MSETLRRVRGLLQAEQPPQAVGPIDGARTAVHDAIREAGGEPGDPAVQEMAAHAIELAALGLEGLGWGSEEERAQFLTLLALALLVPEEGTE